MLGNPQGWEDCSLTKGCIQMCCSQVRFIYSPLLVLAGIGEHMLMNFSLFIISVIFSPLSFFFFRSYFLVFFWSHVPDGLFHPSFSPPPPPSVPIIVSPLILHFFFWLSSPPCPSHPSHVPECSFCSSSPFFPFILVICLSLLSRHLLSVAAFLFQRLRCALKVLEMYMWAKE